MTMLIVEKWRPVSGWSAYEVSDLGRVRRDGRIKKSTVNSVGYPVVNLRLNGHQRVVTVHRLVCEAFYGPPPSSRHEVAHWDGNRQNAAADNLRWATSAENSQDMLRHGTRPRGETSTATKLSAAQVAEIRSKLAAGLRCTDIARGYPAISKYAIYGIKWGRTWKAQGVDA